MYILGQVLVNDPATRLDNLCDGAYGAFWRWLILLGLLLLGSVLAVQQGILEAVLVTDESQLSGLIMVVFIVVSVGAGRRAYALGGELCAARRLAASARSGQPLLALDGEHRVRLAVPDAPASQASGYLVKIASRVVGQRRICEHSMLLEHLEHGIGRGHENGWFIADLMVRLGLLGTVIGFIFMLSSVSEVRGMDLPALQQLLTSMSSGMRIALYTTLTGLGAGILLGFQFRLLDSAADQLVSEIIELTEVDAVGEFQRLLQQSTAEAAAASTDGAPA